LVLIDDHALLLEGLSLLFQSQPDMEVVGKFSNTVKALEFFANQEADLILLDYDLGVERALPFVDQLKQRSIGTRVLVVTAGVGEREARALVEAGVAGILHKHNTPDMLCETIRRVIRGEAFIESRYVKTLFQAVSKPVENDLKLTERDRAVVRFIMQGLANKEIGEQLGISESAVKASLRTVFQKLGVHTRSQLVRVALDRFREEL
jgi:two-component system nitrate/nitrite response regulator NarL